MIIERAGSGWRRGLAAAFAFLAAMQGYAVFSNAAAQSDSAAGYPTRPIKIVVGFAPGGANDLLSRFIAQKLAERLSQPVVVENKPGAGGNVAAELVARAAPDGYTMLMAPSGTLVIGPAVYSKLPFDPLKSFAHITIVATYPLMLSVNGAGPIKSIKELIEFARSHPEKANYSSSSALFQLTSELFNMRAGVKFEHIPFKSGAENVAAVLNGQTTLAFADTAVGTAHFKAGRLRALATTGAKRFPDMPDIPTMKEAGIDGVEVDAFSGLVAPAATPTPIVRKLAGEITAVLATPEAQDSARNLGVLPGGGTPEEFKAIALRDLATFIEVAKAANVKLD